MKYENFMNLLMNTARDKFFEHLLKYSFSQTLTDAEINALGYIPAILDGTYFRIAHCKKLYKGALKSPSNFLKHLQNKHSTLVSQYEKHKTAYAQQKKRQRPDDQDDTNDALPPAKTAARAKMFHHNFQKQADILITDVLVEAALPIRLLETPASSALLQTSGLAKPVI